MRIVRITVFVLLAYIIGSWTVLIIYMIWALTGMDPRDQMGWLLTGLLCQQSFKLALDLWPEIHEDR